MVFSYANDGFITIASIENVEVPTVPVVPIFVKQTIYFHFEIALGSFFIIVVNLLNSLLFLPAFCNKSSWYCTKKRTVEYIVFHFGAFVSELWAKMVIKRQKYDKRICVFHLNVVSRHAM